MNLHAIDVTVIAAYLVAVLALGLYLARRSRGRSGESEDDYFVAGRQLGWFTVGASLFASNISSEHLIGLAGDGFRTGLAVGNYEWGASLVLLVLGGIFVPVYVGNRIRTAPEFLERRFGSGARLYLAGITVLANVFVRISVALFAGAVVLEQFFGLGLWFGVASLAVFTVVYTAAGGLRAVVYTDAIQAAVLLVGTGVLTYLAVDAVGGISGLQRGAPEGAFDMIRPADDPEMPWVGLLLGVPILGIWYWCTDQVIVQRVLGSKNVKHAQAGTLFAAALKVLPVFLFVVPGLCARILYPDIESEAAFPTLLTELLPVGVRGLVAAGLIAALMSSLDSTLNSTGTLVSLDFYQRVRPEAPSAKVVRIGRVVTVLVMLFGIAWVPVVMNAESLFQYLQQVNAAISPPLAAVFLVGVLWRRANHPGALAALGGGLVVGVALLLTEPFPFLICAGITFAASLVLLAAVSLATEPPAEHQVRGLIWSEARQRARAVGGDRWRGFRWGATAVAATMGLLWYAFSGDEAVRAEASDRPTATEDANAAPEPELEFRIREGAFDNRFFRDGPIAAHVVTRSGEAPRSVVAFPAGNTGMAVWLAEETNLRLESPLTPVEDGAMRGVRAEVFTDLNRLTVDRAVLGNIRTIREHVHGGEVPEEARADVEVTENGATWARRRVGGGARYRLRLVPQEGARLRHEDGRVVMEGDGPLHFTLEAATDEPPLTPLSIDDLLTDVAVPDPSTERVLAFLAYEEKWLAGSWRFLTYFGRDTLLSARLLMPALEPSAAEAAVGSVIARVGDDGDVAHEEDVGDFAALRRLHEQGEASAEPLFDTKMIDDELMLAPVAAHYLLDRAPRERARAFLDEPTPTGDTYRERLEANLARVWAQTKNPRAGLLALETGAPVGEWRDSHEGLGGGRIPYSVNASLAPAALRAAARLEEAGLVSLDASPSEARRAADAWDRVRARFLVRIPSSEARRRVETFAADRGIPFDGEAVTWPDSVVLPAVALDETEEPVTVMHTDDGFRLLFNRPDPEELERIAWRLSTPFPAGLWTPIGLVVANPAYEADADVRALFTRNHYHGTVVWSWQHAMLIAGLRRQLERDDLSPETRGALEEAERAVWRAVDGVGERRSSELWSWEANGEDWRAVPFGEGSGHLTESNAAQLWSTVFLALPR